VKDSIQCALAFMLQLQSQITKRY